MTLKTLPPWREKNVELEILKKLNARSGVVHKIDRGGRPLRTATGKTIMIPFKNEFAPKGMSDIFYLENGVPFFFEVKNPARIKWYSKKLKEGTLKMALATNPRYKTEMHQWNFLETVIEYGGAFGGYVSSFRGVEEILALRKSEIYLECFENST